MIAYTSGMVAVNVFMLVLAGILLLIGAACVGVIREHVE